MKIECLFCLKETDIPKNWDTQKYDGQITCRECGSLLQVKLVKSKVQQCKLVKEGNFRLDPAKLAQAMREVKKVEKAWLEKKS